MNAITKAKPFDMDLRILAYYLMFCRAPKRIEPDTDGMYDLSGIGAAPEKNWTKATPYSLAQVYDRPSREGTSCCQRF